MFPVQLFPWCQRRLEALSVFSPLRCAFLSPNPPMDRRVVPMNELDLFAAAIAVADPPELRRRLDQLLDAHARSHNPLDLPVRDALDVTATHAPSDQPGAIVAG